MCERTEKTHGLPQVPVTVVNAGIASSDTSGADEWDLDSQTSTGTAQQVSHLYFYVATSNREVRSISQICQILLTIGADAHGKEGSKYLTLYLEHNNKE